MKIYCSYARLVPTAELDRMRHPRNPNTHSAAQIAAIAAVFEGNGVRQSIVVSNRSGLITRGHGRLDAALMLGYENMPVDFQDYANEREEIADMVADNRLSELSEIDESKLTDVLKELSAAGHDIELAGFTAEQFAALTEVDQAIENLQTIPKMELQAFEHYDYLIFMFKDIRDWLRVLQLLKVCKVDFSISRKTQKIGIGRVINGKTLLGKLENPPRHNESGQAQQHSNPPAAAEGNAGRAN
jgi:hypothetical protein